MHALPGYKNLSQIHDGDNSRVYRAQRVDSGQSVILKILKSDYPTSAQLRRYRHEFKLTSQLKLPNTISAYGLEKWQRTLVIVFEDFDGISLQQHLRSHPHGLSIAEFFPIALQIVEGVGQLHSQNVIHKDINPSNIVFNPDTMLLKLIDFGLSTQMSPDSLAIKLAKHLAGTPHYISPEQTGRLNRILDYRTDFYSLGITFYELLTGKLPFNVNDPMELIHCHIAKQPVPLHLLDAEIETYGDIDRSTMTSPIPEALSLIVMKLMAKDAEERYQNAWSLKADLEECLTQWQAGAIATFPVGKNDRSGQFQIPAKLYGREPEQEALLAAFRRVATTGSELILVKGYAGIGKSALVQEFAKAIAAQGSYFISGKFDQFQRNIPYSAMVSAFANLVEQILGEPEEILQAWRAKLLAALASNAQVAIDLIPRLELIIGAQPPVATLGPLETQNRFNLVLQNFIQVFCQRDRPLAIFLDDLQWTDLATLQSIEHILAGKQIDNLLLLGAYRDHEVCADSPLSLMLEKLKSKEVAISEISLPPLSQDLIEQIIQEMLQSESKAVNGFAELVMHKTQGNPFFVNEFLRILHRDHLLVFDHSSKHWQWDLAQVEARGFTDNVVDLMLEQLQKLPSNVQKSLSMAACLGSEFDLDTLALVENCQPSAVLADLKIAMELGFIRPRSPLDVTQDYQFGHDRIQQAAYYLIPEPERAIAHYQIGQLLLWRLSSEALAERIFTAVNQLNYGVDLIEDRSERDELAKLNLTACRKARMAIAYQAADAYAEIGLNLLGAEAWQRQYEMTLSLHELAAEVALLCGEFDQMDRWIDITIDCAKTPFDRVGVYSIKIQASSIQDKLSEAISVGQSILGELGIYLPNPPSSEDIQQAVREINSAIGDRAIADLFHLPPMLDVEKLAIMKVAAGIGPACFMLGSPLFPSLIALLVKLSLQYGNSPTSGYGYACYGLFLNSFLQDAIAASQFGQLAYRLASSSDAKGMRSETFAIVGLFLYHRQAHLRETLPIFQAGYQAGLEAGNLGFVGHNGNGFCINSFWCGKPLGELESQTRSYHQQFLNFNQLTAASYCSIYLVTTRLLLGDLDEIACSEENLVSQLSATNNLAGLFQFYLYRAMRRFLMGDIALAAIDTLQTRLYIAAGVQTVTEPVFYFYDSLIAIAVDGSTDDSEAQLQRVRENQTKLHHWAEYAPMNYLHKWQLVEAETFRVLGQKLQAIELYELAIAGAREHQYIQEEALASELAARFYLDWDKETIARTYMTEARYCYSLWGATAKVTQMDAQLDAQYSQLYRSLDRKSSLGLSLSLSDIDSHTISSDAALDLHTVMKSSQAISSEIVLENLLQTLMKILVENAGAQTGCLLLHTPKENGSKDSGELGDFTLEAYSSINANSVIVPNPASENGIFPQSVIHYVARTLDLIVLDRSAEQGNFTSDPYIQSVKPLSVLCYPLRDRGKLVAIVYLENNATTGAFTTKRVELLQLLSGQAAIAIINAQLYTKVKEYSRTLEQQVAERTLELESKNRELLRLATLDGLTQIANRLCFDNYLEAEWKRHLREQQPLALILIDIDYFKPYNDYYGHQGGDDCLIAVARALGRVLQRPSDLVARYGGEEFVAVLPNTNITGALVVAEAIQKQIATLAIPHANSKVSNHVTASLGVASLTPNADIGTAYLIAKADAALYAAKDRGRDRVAS